MKTFKSYWRSLSAPEKDALASRLETSTNYLYQIAGGHRQAGKHLSRLIRFETGLPQSAMELQRESNAEN